MSEPPSSPQPRGRLLWRIVRVVLVLFLLLVLAVAGVAWYEMEASPLQARYLTRLGREMRYQLGEGPSDLIRFPAHGPFDERLGYVALPALRKRLEERAFEVSAQARISQRMAQVVDRGLFEPYREKTQTGLEILDCEGQPLYVARNPGRVYRDFASVPRMLADTLLFIENRELLSNRYATKNPAVEWSRFARAVFDQLVSRIQPGRDAPGGSTLATQIEKYRHSPGGRTASGEEKLRQMASASVRAYLGGEDTTKVRRQLVVDYLNTVPLSAWPGYGEVIGLGDGMWVWYGSDFDETNRLLRDETAPLQQRARAYKRALSLMISQRRPSGYLLEGQAELEHLTNSFLRLVSDAGIITPELRDAALAQPLARRPGRVNTPRTSFASRKGANSIRNDLLDLLGRRPVYELDRLDLQASSTLRAALQQAVTERLRDLARPQIAAASGLNEERLLAGSDPAGVLYSFTLYERTEQANVVRVQADTLDQPLDINAGTKLDLGSTAKLRTLITYLEIIARLHQQLSPLSAEELAAFPVASTDAITRWAVDYLLQATDDARSLESMLEASLDRRYSASPKEVFFTGGGIMRFENFDPDDDRRELTVREGLQRSVNLLFIRLMRDIVRYTMATLPSASATLLDDPTDPKRAQYLARFADREGSEYLLRFYRKYRGRSPQEAETLLLTGIRPTPRRLAAIHRYIAPRADIGQFTEFLRRNLPDAKLPEAAIPRLYRDYAAERYDLADRGYIAGVHPLELWVVGYLRSEPAATWQQVVASSQEQRQTVYGWLFKTRSKAAQDRRIRTLVELEAFEEIHRSWQRLGYPFGSLSPSYATALGSSADRPAALAELMGILVNDGVRLPVVKVDALRFAAGTPYETHFRRRQQAGERVLPVELTRVARRTLALVVQGGTARRLDGVFTAPNGTPLVVGGKTGTGDHRFETYGKGGVLLSSRVVSRSGTIVFYVGDRYFGVLTAYVKGPDAARYTFTSALPTQILKTLAPLLGDEINREARVGTSCAANASLRPRPPPAVPQAGPGEQPAAPGTEALDTVPPTHLEQPDSLEPAPVSEPSEQPAEAGRKP